jgi:NADPH:quinone reductase-like Zn-dependent oxidoreductase
MNYKKRKKKKKKTIGSCWLYSKNVYVTVGSDEKVKFCESLGATKGINYKTQKWGDEVH